MKSNEIKEPENCYMNCFMVVGDSMGVTIDRV